jgi:hypothetical protein
MDDLSQKRLYFKSKQDGHKYSKQLNVLSRTVIQCFKMYSVPDVKLNLSVKYITVTAVTIRANIGPGYKSY